MNRLQRLETGCKPCHQRLCRRSAERRKPKANHIVTPTLRPALDKTADSRPSERSGHRRLDRVGSCGLVLTWVEACELIPEERMLRRATFVRVLAGLLFVAAAAAVLVLMPAGGSAARVRAAT